MKSNKSNSGKLNFNKYEVVPSTSKDKKFDVNWTGPRSPRLHGAAKRLAQVAWASGTKPWPAPVLKPYKPRVKFVAPVAA